LQSHLPSHSLELNLILVFIYLAARPYGFTESEILTAANQNKIEYLTAYRNYGQLKKAFYLLRPINVPMQNKWLRETAQNLVADGLEDTPPTPTLIFDKMCKHLDVEEEVKNEALQLIDEMEMTPFFEHYWACGSLIVAYENQFSLYSSEADYQSLQKELDRLHSRLE